MDITLPDEVTLRRPTKEASSTTALQHRCNYVFYPVPKEQEIWGPGQAGCGLSVGRNGVAVYRAKKGLLLQCHRRRRRHVVRMDPTWRCDTRDGVPSIYLNGKSAQGRRTWNAHLGLGLEEAQNQSTRFKARFPA